MRILLLTEQQYPHVIGGGKAVLKIFEKYLQERQIDYDIYCPRWKFNTNYSWNKIRSFSIPYLELKNKYLRQLYKVPYILSWYFLTTLFLVFSKKKYDIIFVQENLFSGYFSLFLGRIFKIPIVFQEHTPGTLQAFQDKLGLSNKSLHNLEKVFNFFRKKVDIITFVSRRAFKKYKHLNKESYFIPNSIVMKEFTKRKPPRKIRNLGFSGRICYDKRVDLMIKTMHKFPDLNLKIIGRGPPKEEGEMKDMAKKFGLKNVFFEGFTDDINKKLDEVDILLMLWEKESFGIAALEAMAKGIPIIAADVQEMHYFVGREKAGIVLKNINEKSLYEAISKIKKSPKLYKKFSQKAIKVANSYDYRKISKKYEDLFRRLLENGKD